MFAVSQEIPRILWNPIVRYRIHKRPTPVPILRTLDPVHTSISRFPKIHLNIILPPITGSPKWSLAHVILLDFIIRKIFGEEYRSKISPLRCFLHSPVTSSLSGPDILLYTLFSNTLFSNTLFSNTLFSNTLSLLSFLNNRDKFSHPYKTTGKIIVMYILIFNVLDSKLEDKIFCAQLYQAFPGFNLLLIFPE